MVGNINWWGKIRSRETNSLPIRVRKSNKAVSTWEGNWRTYSRDGQVYWLGSLGDYRIWEAKVERESLRWSPGFSFGWERRWCYNLLWNATVFGSEEVFSTQILPFKVEFEVKMGKPGRNAGCILWRFLQMSGLGIELRS